MDLLAFRRRRESNVKSAQEMLQHTRRVTNEVVELQAETRRLIGETQALLSEPANDYEASLVTRPGLRAD